MESNIEKDSWTVVSGCSDSSSVNSSSGASVCSNGEEPRHQPLKDRMMIDDSTMVHSEEAWANFSEKLDDDALGKETEKAAGIKLSQSDELCSLLFPIEDRPKSFLREEEAGTCDQNWLTTTMTTAWERLREEEMVEVVSLRYQLWGDGKEETKENSGRSWLGSILTLEWEYLRGKETTSP